MGIAVVGTAVETMEDGFVVESDVFSFENDVFLLSSIAAVNTLHYILN